ncbi:MAG TPA: NAD(P)-dependent oxidoreductase, partial [Thermoanaerobaculia bacterium]|nr:NAD(P)-dependent oxidoreductase [Thermoanaerobaculia bacterium]
MRVLVPDPLMEYERALLGELLAAAGHQPVFAVHDAAAEALLTGGPPLSRSRLQEMPSLRVLVRFARGRHDISEEAAAVESAGISYRHVAGASAASTAEHTLMLILALLRRLPQAHALMTRGQWGQREIAEMGVRDLAEVTVGLIGLGRVGRRLARLLQGFGPRVLYTKPHPLTAAEERDLGISWVPLDDLLRRADVVSLHARTPGSGVPLLTREHLGRMRPDAVLVNTGAGGHVDLEALNELLTERPMGVGLDVFPLEPAASPPLSAGGSVLLTPHVAGRSRATARDLFARAVAQLDSATAGVPAVFPIPIVARPGPVLRQALRRIEERRPFEGCGVRLPPRLARDLPALSAALEALGVAVDAAGSGRVELSTSSGTLWLGVDVESPAPEPEAAFSLASLPTLRVLRERWRVDWRAWDLLLPRHARGSLPGRRLVVEGYGPRGRRIAWRARALGVEVLVAETSTARRLEALFDGFEAPGGASADGADGDLILATGETDTPAHPVFGPVEGIPPGLADETAAAVLLALAGLRAAAGRDPFPAEEVAAACDRELAESVLAARGAAR